MQWSHLLAKLSPERVQPNLREGQCKPPADYNNENNMPSDYHDSPPEEFDADDQEQRSSIGNFSILAPPMSHRQPHNYPGPQPDLHQPHSFLDGTTTSYDPPFALATTLNSGSAVAPSAPVHGITHTDHSDGLTLPNPHPPSPHPPWMHGQAPLPNVPPPQQQPLYRGDGYAPAENLPPQNYISFTRIAPSSGTPYIRPGSRGASLLLRRQGVSPPDLSIQTTVVPPNSELARSPRFTFAPPGAYVPADPIVCTTAAPASPKSAHSFRDKGKTRFDRTRQPTQEGSSGRARSNSWTVVSSVSSVFRRRSGRRPPGPAPLITDSSPPPQLTASDWRDLAHWAFRPTDHNWGESFASHVDIAPAPPVDHEAISNFYDHSLPPLPSHLSHLPVPSAPLLRTNSSTSALNPFLVHRHTGVPPISWDLRTSARSVLFPTSSSGPGGPTPPSTVPMALSDYAQPATWPPCGALRIGAIGGRVSVWRWPVDVINPAGVRCGDVFRALIANLHMFVRPYELADMLPEQVSLASAACHTRVRAGLPHGPSWSSDPSAAATDGIRRVDLLLGQTQFYGLVPGPSPGEWTMYVGVL